ISYVPLMLGEGVLGIRDRLADPLSIAALSSERAMPGTTGGFWQWAVQLAQLGMALFWVATGLAALGVKLMLTKRDSTENDLKLWVSLGLFVVLVGAGLALGSAFVQSGLYRAYFLCVPLLGTLFLLTLRPPKALMLGLCLIVLAVSFIARYGQENLISPGPEVVEAAETLSSFGVSGTSLTFTDEAGAFFAGISISDVLAPDGSLSTIHDLEKAIVGERQPEPFSLREENLIVIDRQATWRLQNYGIAVTVEQHLE
ncbi:unnamed protein product, partial [marine sediment metagenome]